MLKLSTKNNNNVSPFTFFPFVVSIQLTSLIFLQLRLLENYLLLEIKQGHAVATHDCSTMAVAIGINIANQISMLFFLVLFSDYLPDARAGVSNVAVCTAFLRVSTT